jgi:hypothetical protein
MEGPTPVGPQRALSIDDLPPLDSRREDDQRDLLESVFIDDHVAADGTVSPAWVEIPPDDISLRAAQTLYPPPAPRKRIVSENTVLTALAVVATMAAGTVLFFLARGPSRPAATAARPPAVQAPLPSPSAPPDAVPLTSRVERSPEATTLTVPGSTPAAPNTPAARESPAAKAAATETARLNTQTAARRPVPSALPPRPDPNVEAAAQLARPSTEIARRLEPAARTPEAPITATPPVAAAATPAPVTAAPPVTAPPVVTAAAAVTPPAAAPPAAPAAALPATAPPAAVPPVVTPPGAAAPAPTTTVAAAAPRPAVPAAPPPAALATEEQGIRAVVERYRAAYSALDVNAVRAIWPGVNARALGRAFDQLSTQQLEFAGCEISVAGERASAGCSGNMEFVPKIGNRTPRLEARTWSFVLRKSGAQWTIEAVESR